MSHNQTTDTHDEAPPKILRVRVQGQKISALKDTTKITYNRYIRSFAEEHARQCQEREDRRMKVEQWRKQTLGKKSATFSQTDLRSHASTLKSSQKPSGNSDNNQTPLKPSSAITSSLTLPPAAPTPTHMAEESATSDIEESIFQIRIIGGEEVPANAGYMPLDVDSPIAQYPHDNSNEYGQSIHSIEAGGAGEDSAANGKEDNTSENNESGKMHCITENPESSNENHPPTPSFSTSLPVVTIGRHRVHSVRMKPCDIMAYMGGGNMRTRPQSKVPSTTGVNHYMFRTWEEMVDAGKNPGNPESKNKSGRKGGKSGELAHNAQKGERNTVNTDNINDGSDGGSDGGSDSGSGSGNGGGGGGSTQRGETTSGQENSHKGAEATVEVTDMKSGDVNSRVAGKGDLGIS